MNSRAKPATMVVRLGIAALLAGCATRQTGSPVYPRTQVNQSYTTETGTVLGVTRVTIEGTASNTGRIAGGGIGAGIGATTVNGPAGAVAAGVGSAAGIIVGQEVEKMVTAKPGLEITVVLDNGDVIVVVQEEEFTFMDGDIVRVLRGSGGYAKVMP